MNHVHITFAPFLASIAPPPIDTVQQREALAADLAYNDDKAHRMNSEAFIAAMQQQINDNTGAFK